MKFLIDGQISEKFVPWLSKEYGHDVFHIKDFGLENAEDTEVFQKAKDLHAVVITKDRDFILLQERLGVPPPIVWVTCGNTSNRRLKIIFSQVFPNTIDLIVAGEGLVEISDTV